MYYDSPIVLQDNKSTKLDTILGWKYRKMYIIAVVISPMSGLTI